MKALTIMVLLGSCLLDFAVVTATASVSKEEPVPFVTATSKLLDGEVKVFAMRDQTYLAAPPLNALHKILINLAVDDQSSAKVTSVEFDATMPAHRHGMLVKPKAEKAANGKFVIEGVKLHMPGDWELTITLKAGQKSETIKIPYTLALGRS